MLEALPYEPPIIEEVQVNDEEVVDNSAINSENKTDGKNDDGQTALF